MDGVKPSRPCSVPSNRLHAVHTVSLSLWVTSTKQVTGWYLHSGTFNLLPLRRLWNVMYWTCACVYTVLPLWVCPGVTCNWFHFPSLLPSLSQSSSSALSLCHTHWKLGKVTHWSAQQGADTEEAHDASVSAWLAAPDATCCHVLLGHTPPLHSLATSSCKLGLSLLSSFSFKPPSSV